MTALDLQLASAEKSKLRRNQTQSFEAWNRYAAGLDADDVGREGSHTDRPWQLPYSKSLEERRQEASLDWEQALLDNEPDTLKLLALSAKKAHK